MGGSGWVLGARCAAGSLTSGPWKAECACAQDVTGPWWLGCSSSALRWLEEGRASSGLTRAAGERGRGRQRTWSMCGGVHFSCASSFICSPSPHFSGISLLAPPSMPSWAIPRLCICSFHGPHFPFSLLSASSNQENLCLLSSLSVSDGVSRFTPVISPTFSEHPLVLCPWGAGALPGCKLDAGMSRARALLPRGSGTQLGGPSRSSRPEGS